MESTNSNTTPANPDAHTLFTYPEAVRYLRISTSSIYRLVVAGKLKSVHIGSSARITRAELDRFVAELDGRDI